MADWLDDRRPEPPEDLRLRLNTPGASAGPELVDALVTEAVAAMDRARAAPGRVRESALDLLVADALLSYACEAALELPDADDVLAGIARRAAEAR